MSLLVFLLLASYLLEFLLLARNRFLELGDSGIEVLLSCLRLLVGSLGFDVELLNIFLCPLQLLLQVLDRGFFLLDFLNLGLALLRKVVPLLGHLAERSLEV